MFHEYDVVILIKALPGTSVPVLTVGTIVHVHDGESQAYEVEFVDENHQTIDVCTVIGDENLKLKSAYRETQ
jgi:hypothetical protein